MPYKNCFTTIKQKLFQENSLSSLQQSIPQINFIKWDWQYYSRGRRNFLKKTQVGLPKVSKLIGLAISKRRGDRKKYRFLERKKILYRRENGFTMSTQNITSLDGSSYEAIHSSISQNIFSYLKMFFHISGKLLQLRITKKEWI